MAKKRTVLSGTKRAAAKKIAANLKRKSTGGGAKGNVASSSIRKAR